MKYLLLISMMLSSYALMPVSSRTYREKYASVIVHYSQNADDSLKLRAALFLIDNMEGHYSPEGGQVEKFKMLSRTVGKTKGNEPFPDAVLIQKKYTPF